MRRRRYLAATAGAALASGCLRLQEQGGAAGDGQSGGDGSENVVTVDDAGDGGESWPMQRYDPANTAYNPDGTVPRDVPDLIGSVDAGLWLPADGLLAGGSAYFPAGDGRVGTIDPETGDPQWESDRMSGTVIPEVVVAEGILGARATDGTTYGIDRPDGSVSLEFPFGGPGVGLTPTDDGTYVAPAYDGWVRRVNPPEETVEWETPVGGAAMPAAVGDGTVFVSVIRDEETDPDVVDWGSPHEIDAGGFLSVMNAEDGEIVGQRSRDAFALAPPAIGDGLLYWAGFDGEIITIDLEGPAEAWRFEADGGIFRSPVLADGVAVVGTESGTVYGIDAASGDEEWSVSVDGPVRGGPIGLGDTVLAGSDGGSLYAFDVGSGELLWQFEAESPVISLTAGDGRVHAGTQSAIHTLGE